MLLGFGALASGVAARRPDGSVVDLSAVSSSCASASLLPVLEEGPSLWARLRASVASAPLADPSLAPLLPVAPPDFTDFYACAAHVTAMGALFRPGQPPLPAAWPHVPQGYTGRSSTVVVSGTPVARPAGVVAPGTYGPSARLDVEVELGFVVGVGTPLGRSVPASRAWPHLFGAVVLNDWSARDIQSFETAPLGPHIGKSFATSISPWVVPMDLLPTCACPGTGVPPVSYLSDPGPGVDVSLTLRIDGVVVSSMTSASLSWTPAQLFAQLTVGGAATRPGDLLGTGTISGPGPGSLVEGGLPFLSDGCVVSIESPQLGSVTGRITPCPTTAA